LLPLICTFTIGGVVESGWAWSVILFAPSSFLTSGFDSSLLQLVIDALGALITLGNDGALSGVLGALGWLGVLGVDMLGGEGVGTTGATFSGLVWVGPASVMGALKVPPAAVASDASAASCSGLPWST
jgi:hypothetical protein